MNPPVPSEIAAIVLAAGRSTRMGEENKLLAQVNDRPLVRIAVETALASSAGRVIVVTGHERGKVEAALAGLDVGLVHNPAYAEGLSTSLRAGLNALPPGIAGALILLADMPYTHAALIDEMIRAFADETSVVVPTIDGKRGNPVLWGRRYFEELKRVTGDVGGRDVLKRLGSRITEVPVRSEAAFLDIDTPDQLRAARGRPAAD